MTFWAKGLEAPFWMFSGDTFLYLGIAQNSHGLWMSFDGLAPTNGFNPLWQVLVRVIVLIFPDPVISMIVLAWMAILMATVGSLILARTIARVTGYPWLGILAVPGAYFLLIGQALGNLPIWSFLDGMEGALGLVWAALLVDLITRRETISARAFPWRLGVLLAGLVLTRFDEVFIVACLVLATLVEIDEGPGWRARLVRMLKTATIPALAVMAYLLWSKATTGEWVPISGQAKSEGALLANAWVTMAALFSPLVDLRAALTSYFPERIALTGGTFRVLELVIPALFALGFFAYLRRLRPLRGARLFLAALCLGVVFKSAFLFALVNYWHQAMWYFALPVTLMTLGVALALKPLVQWLETTTPAANRVLAAMLTAVSLFHASYWSADTLTATLPVRQSMVWQNRASIEERLIAAVPDARMVEFGDGFLNFSFDMPVRHGFVFAGDPGSLDALQNARFLQHSHDQGFTLLSSYDYLSVPRGAENWSSDEIRDFLNGSFLDARVKAELEAFSFEMVYVYGPAGIPFIRFWPRSES